MKRVCLLGLWAASAWAGTTTVQVASSDFVPDPVIQVGDTVQWVWSTGGSLHSTTAAAGQSESWDSGLHTQPFTFRHTFTQAGTFNYYCRQHGGDLGGGSVAGMAGRVVVQSPPLANMDVVAYAVAKGRLFEQTVPGFATPMATGFAFHASALGVESNSFLEVTCTRPGQPPIALVQASPDGLGWSSDVSDVSSNALDAAYPNGVYTQSITTANSGILTGALLVVGTNYPPAPVIANFTAAQSLVASTNFVLSWLPFTGGTTQDLILVEIRDSVGDVWFATPAFYETNAIRGAATAVTIPGNTLSPAAAYQAQLMFIRANAPASPVIPDAVGLGGTIALTRFAMATLATNEATCDLLPTAATNVVGQVASVSAIVRANGVPVSNVTVTFSVTSGPNAGLSNTGSGATDANGRAVIFYQGLIPGTDSMQATGVVGDLAFTGTASIVWLQTNVLPFAACSNVTVAVGDNCAADVLPATVDAGSFDPDGIIASRTLAPAGPFGLGNTNVTLTVIDDRGGSSSCLATITVVDQTAPMIMCHADIVTNVPHGTTSALVMFDGPVASDNCNLANATYSPAPGSVFNTGSTSVTGTAIDTAGNTNTCTFNVTVNELPPDMHDLAVTKVKAPKKAKLSATVTNVVGRFSVTLQNRGTLTETIPNHDVLTNLVTVDIQSLGSCPSFQATVVPPVFPIVIASKKKVTLAYTANLNCDNGLAGDYHVTVAVHHEAIDGNTDTFPADDIAPRGPLSDVPFGTGAIFDKGVGGKNPDGTLGAPIVIDVILN